MYNEKNLERLRLISQKIEYILQNSSAGIAAALEDDKILRPAILMYLVACNEQLQKIQDSGDLEVLSLFSPKDITGLRGARNATAQDFERIKLAIIENIIRSYLPEIKQNIDIFLEKSKHKGNK